MPVLDQVETWIVALAASPWVFAVVLLFVAIDGFFPPLPSESAVIALAVVSHTSGEPNLAALAAVTAIGAWSGDQIAFSIGRGIGTERIPALRTRRGRATVAWAAEALARRGASLVLVARYIPVGRVAVNTTAGAVGFERRRFMAYSGLAALAWSAGSVAIGVLSAQWLGHRPLVAMAAGIAFGVACGYAIDRFLARRARAADGGRPSRTPVGAERAVR